MGELADPRVALRKTTTQVDAAGEAIAISARGDEGRWRELRFDSFSGLEDYFAGMAAADAVAEPGSWVRGVAVGDPLRGGAVRAPLLVAFGAANWRRGASMDEAVANLAAEGERCFAYETGEDSFVIVAARLARSDMGLLRAAVAIADLARLDCTIEITPRSRALALPEPGARLVGAVVPVAEQPERLAS